MKGRRVGLWAQIFAPIIAVFFLFNFRNNFSHGLHNQGRVLTSSSFPTQHNRISTFQHSIGNVGNFTSIGFYPINHALHHLGGHNNGLGTMDTFANQLFLNKRNFFYRQFNTQVAPGNHDTIAFNNNIPNIYQRFRLFNFGDNFSFAVLFF